MSKSKFSESQIVAILKEGEAGVALSELVQARAVLPLQEGPENIKRRGSERCEGHGC
jgi:hypothetical protein